MYTEVRFVMDENGIIYAKLPDGTCREVLVDVHESAWYGFLSVGPSVNTMEET